MLLRDMRRVAVRLPKVVEVCEVERNYMLPHARALVVIDGTGRQLRQYIGGDVFTVVVTAVHAVSEAALKALFPQRAGSATHRQKPWLCCGIPACSRFSPGQSMCSSSGCMIACSQAVAGVKVRQPEG